MQEDKNFDSISDQAVFSNPKKIKTKGRPSSNNRLKPLNEIFSE